MEFIQNFTRSHSALRGSLETRKLEHKQRQLDYRAVETEKIKEGKRNKVELCKGMGFPSCIIVHQFALWFTSLHMYKCISLGAE